MQKLAVFTTDSHPASRTHMPCYMLYCNKHNPCLFFNCPLQASQIQRAAGKAAPGHSSKQRWQ
jgi:hypothetical protein